MVFQNYALYPHMDVRRNLGFGLKIKGVPKAVVNERVTAAAQMLELTEHLHKRPGQLSGGQRQRVAMGRAIVREPQVFLMDEPLSNLDAKLRVMMRAEIVALQQELQTTMVHVTHDQVEAMTMGRRVAILRRGVLQQVAPPDELFDSPVNVFVASFIGTPSMNLYHGSVTTPDDGSRRLEMGIEAMDYSTEDLQDTVLARCGDGPVVVGIRPHDVELRPIPGPARRPSSSSRSDPRSWSMRASRPRCSMPTTIPTPPTATMCSWNWRNGSERRA